MAYFSGQRRRTSQRGAVAVMVVGMLFVIFGVCGLAIDLSLMLNRRVELQNLANATALAAAAELDGTPAGVTRALANAASTAGQLRIQYGLAIDWNDAAVQFANRPDRDADWVAADTARGAPDGRLYVRVDTHALGDAAGLVSTVFMNVLSASRDTVIRGVAIAGRSGINVAPLAICANASTAAAARTTGAGDELVEFGFRRGIGYNLMKLNPNGTAPENFVVHPFLPPGATSAGAAPATAIVGPYLCTGTMSMPRVTGGAITVSKPFPLGDLMNHLNSRFDQYTGNVCNRFSAPPDANIKAYPYTGISWMSTVPLAQGASASSDGGKLQTVADPSPATATSAGAYGPLWAYAKAVPFSAYVAGAREPSAGYTGFTTSNWSTLYNPGGPAATAYPSAPPYQATTGGNFLGPGATLRGTRNRRVLNIPLLACPVPAGTTAPATVLGIGKFFMTVPATATDIYAEFAGAVPEQALSPPVGLFP